jgi:hypothetical protein
MQVPHINGDTNNTKLPTRRTLWERVIQAEEQLAPRLWGRNKTAVWKDRRKPFVGRRDRCWKVGWQGRRTAYRISKSREKA